MLLPEFFEIALQLTSPWKLAEVELKQEEKDKKQLELHINIDFAKGAKFSYEDENGNIIIDENGNEKKFPVHDTVVKTWRHLNFFQYKTYIHARVPRIKLDDGKVKVIKVPWARKGSRFTLFFEIDKFHVIKYFNDAVDKVRKTESHTNSELKRTKYIWLKNESNLTKNNYYYEIH